MASRGAWYQTYILGYIRFTVDKINCGEFVMNLFLCLSGTIRYGTVGFKKNY